MKNNFKLTGPKKTKVARGGANLTSNHRASSTDGLLPRTCDSEDKEEIIQKETRKNRIVRVTKQMNDESTMTDKEIITIKTATKNNKTFDNKGCIKTKPSNCKYYDTEPSDINRGGDYWSSESYSSIPPDLTQYQELCRAILPCCSPRKECGISAENNVSCPECCGLPSQTLKQNSHTNAPSSIENKKLNIEVTAWQPYDTKSSNKLIKDPSKYKRDQVTCINCKHSNEKTSKVKCERSFAPVTKKIGFNENVNPEKTNSCCSIKIILKPSLEFDEVTKPYKKSKKEKMFCAECERMRTSLVSSSLCLQCSHNEVPSRMSSVCLVCKERLSKKNAQQSTSCSFSNAKENLKQASCDSIKSCRLNKSNTTCQKLTEIVCPNCQYKLIKPTCRGFIFEKNLFEPNNKCQEKDERKAEYTKCFKKHKYEQDLYKKCRSCKKSAPIKKSFASCQAIQDYDIKELNKHCTRCLKSPPMITPTPSETYSAYKQGKCPICLDQKHESDSKERNKDKICPACSQCLSLINKNEKMPTAHKYNFKKLQENGTTSSECIVCSKDSKNKLSSDSLCKLCEVKLALAKYFSDAVKKRNFIEDTGTSCKICRGALDEDKTGKLNEIKPESWHLMVSKLMASLFHGSSTFESSARGVDVGNRAQNLSSSPAVPKSIDHRQSGCPKGRNVNICCPKPRKPVSPCEKCSMSTCCRQDAATETFRSARYDVRPLCNLSFRLSCRTTTKPAKLPFLGYKTSMKMPEWCCNCKSDSYLILQEPRCYRNYKCWYW